MTPNFKVITDAITHQEASFTKYLAQLGGRNTGWSLGVGGRERKIEAVACVPVVLSSRLGANYKAHKYY